MTANDRSHEHVMFRDSVRAFVAAEIAPNIDAGDEAQSFATQTMQWCADAAVQILGGMGDMRDLKSERIYREVKVMMIGGGAEEIMKELAAKQLGI